MTSPTANSSGPNLATLLLVKRKMAAANKADPNAKQTLPEPPPVATGSHSIDKMTYRQDISTINPIKTTPLVEETQEPPKVSRKTKQLEVGLLDKKMEEINRKQEIQTNATLDSWKGFDSLNYGFNPESSSPKPNLIPPVAKKQQAPPSSAKRQPSPVKPPSPPPREPSPVKPASPPPRQPSPVKPSSPPPRQPSPVKPSSPPPRQPSPVKPTSPPPRQPTPKHIDSPTKDQPVSKPASPKKEEPREKTPLQQKTIEKQPSPSPVPERETVDNQPSPPPPPPPPRQHSAKKQPSPPPQQEPVEKQSSPPPRQEPVEKQPSPPLRQEPVEKPPTPPPRRSRIQSVSSLKQATTPDIADTKSEPSKSPAPIIENIYPISSVIANPQIFEKNSPPFEQSPISTPNPRQFKLFPEVKHYGIKPTKNAHKSIQRSMDRYRFHLW